MGVAPVGRARGGVVCLRVDSAQRVPVLEYIEEQ